MKLLNIKNALAIVSLVLLASCGPKLDINISPNTAITVSPDLIFNYALTAWSSNRTGGDSYIPFALSSQNQASAGNFGWGKGDVYDISPFSTGNTWRGYYATSGNNFVLAIKQAESATPANNNAAAQCKILLANMMFEATTIWGDVPYSEAWKDDISYPKFDAQPEVFAGILALLDKAIAQIDMASPLKIGNYDLLYKGDMAKWKQYANSLKFKILMTMVDKDPSKAAAIGQLLTSSSMINDASSNVLYPYTIESGKENPKFKVLKQYAGGANLFFFANNNVYKYMAPLNDPRIPIYFDNGPTASTIIPVETEEDGDDNTATINVKTLFKADAPDIIYTYQEQLFFEAEAYARGIGVAANLSKADELYKKGISEAMKFYNVSGSNASTYLTAVPSLAIAVSAVDEIHKQQWIDLMDRPQEAFLQWRRSGTDATEFPQLIQPSGTPAGGFLRRWNYPQSAEIIPNVNAPKTAIPFTTKLWFDL